MSEQAYVGFDEKPREAPQPIRVSWLGNPWSLAGLCLLNVLLIVITVGIYWFWARSEYRRHMWQMVRIEDEPLEYSGTGRELLSGYIRLFLFVIVPAIVIAFGSQLIFGPRHPAVIFVTFVLYFSLLFLYFAGVFRAHRYILSRTRWRGIAFGVGPGAGGYAWTSFWTGFLSALTIGWLWPWRTVALRRRLTSAMYFGSIPFRFDPGFGASLYTPFAFLWLSFLTFYIPVISMQAQLNEALRQSGDGTRTVVIHPSPAQSALMLAGVLLVVAALSWYEARKLNLFAEATGIEGVYGTLKASGGSIFWLTFSNVLILVLSLGILRPVAQARRLRYLVERFSFAGSTDLSKVLREQRTSGIEGAGLEAAFSIEIF